MKSSSNDAVSIAEGLLAHLSPRTYGLRTRFRRFRRFYRTVGDNRELLRWFPWRHLLEPYGEVDLSGPWERAWMSQCLARSYHGVGAVVELGSWLGATSLAIGRGLEANRRTSVRNRPVHVFDRFTYHDAGHLVPGTVLAPGYREGASFRSIYDERTRAVSHRLVVHEGDVEQASWPGDPIEVLFNDLSKTWSTWRAVRRIFYGSLVASSVVIEQDWSHACTPWLHLAHHRFRSYLEPIAQLPDGGAVAFRVRRPLPGELLADDTLADYSPKEVDAAFAWAESLVDERMKPNVRGAKIMLQALHGNIEVGVEALLEACAEGVLAGEALTIAGPELLRRRREASGR